MMQFMQFFWVYLELMLEFNKNGGLMIQTICGQEYTCTLCSLLQSGRAQFGD